MLDKIKFYVIGCLASSMIGAIIVGLNVLFRNIYQIIKGKEFIFHMTSSLIIFGLVFIIAFVTYLKRSPSNLTN